MSIQLLVPVCPQCQGTGITRQDWVQVPVWRTCTCSQKFSDPPVSVVSTIPKG